MSCAAPEAYLSCPQDGMSCVQIVLMTSRTSCCANVICHHREDLGQHAQLTCTKCTAACVSSCLLLRQKMHCLLLMPAHLSLFVHTERCQSFQNIAMYHSPPWSCPLPLSFADLSIAACLAVVTPVSVKTIVARLAASTLCAKQLSSSLLGMSI